jgi:hypothetical protein
LFLSRDQGSVQTTIPVIQALSQALSTMPDIRPVVFSLTVSRALLDKHGIAHTPLDEQAYADNPREHLGTVLDRWQPHLVVSGSSPAKTTPPETPEQFLLLAARRRGIPTVAILDYWGLYRERFVTRGNKADPELLPDRLCILDRLCHDDLTTLGIPAERMSITHNPWVDSVVRSAESPPAASSLLRNARRTILFVSQPLAESAPSRSWRCSQDRLLEELIDALPLGLWDGLTRVLVWKHPAEAPDRWLPAKLPRRDGVEVVVSEERGGAVLAHVDLLATSHSTVAYEALYYGTPCVSLGMNDQPRDHVVDRIGLSVSVPDAKALHDLLVRDDLVQRRQDLLVKKRRLIADGIFFSDGRATERVLALIYNMLSSHPGMDPCHPLVSR